MKAKAKEVVDTQVSDNGQVEKATPEMELESILEQYNDAIAKRNQYDNLATRCLGAIEVLERITKKDSDAEVRKEE